MGLVTAACFAELGHDVYVRDIVPEKVESLSRGEVPIYEPGLADIVEKNAERLNFTTEMGDVLSKANLLFVCVDTPPTYSGDADLSRVERVVEELGDSKDHALVMKSTVPVGTGRSIQRRREDLGYVSNPEFLKEGTAVQDFMRPDRVVIGANEESKEFGDRVAALYEPLDTSIVRTDVASSEMVKLASNAFLATKISFINEIANVCEEVGADVSEVATGMGLDPRIGSQFLRAGAGWGGSCLVGEETVLVRRGGHIVHCTLADLYEAIADQQGVEVDDEPALAPEGFEVLSWRPDGAGPEFLPVALATRRPYSGDVIEVRTKMGRRVTVTPDHPFVIADAAGDGIERKLAEELTESDWVPLAQGGPSAEPEEPRLSPEDAEIGARGASAAIVRLSAESTAELRDRMKGDHTLAVGPRGRQRMHDIVRAGAARLDEALELDASLTGASVATVTNGSYVPLDVPLDETFWHIAGLYIAEGHCSTDGRRRRLQWSFHPTDEQELVDQVADYWRSLGVKASVYRKPTTTCVIVSSRILADWWLDVLGMGRNCYEQRIPDAAFSQPEPYKRALLAGLWLGDGSWSYVAHGPSVTLEYGTASRALADGILRLLGDVGVVASQRVARTPKSTVDTYWLSISGADQVERVLDLVPEAERAEITGSIARQAKRIAPTGYRRRGNAAWVRVVKKLRKPFDGHVYSLEVLPSHTFVTTTGLVISNCFPKDVMALKQLAGNSGYHFQLLTAVIDVNELQKRRTVGKLQKHLGSLVNKEIALLGVAFKPNTDDIREATSLVLAARLQSEGAHVRVYDPVAAEKAREMLGGATIAASALEALDGADGAVLVTEWAEFQDLDWTGEVKERMKNPLVVDGRNFLDREALAQAGFTYEGVGR